LIFNFRIHVSYSAQSGILVNNLIINNGICIILTYISAVIGGIRLTYGFKESGLGNNYPKRNISTLMVITSKKLIKK